MFNRLFVGAQLGRLLRTSGGWPWKFTNSKWLSVCCLPCCIAAVHNIYCVKVDLVWRLGLSVVYHMHIWGELWLARVRPRLRELFWLAGFRCCSVNWVQVLLDGSCWRRATLRCNIQSLMVLNCIVVDALGLLTFGWFSYGGLSLLRGCWLRFSDNV